MIAVVVPVLGRPHRAKPLAENLAAATDGAYRLVWVATHGDDAQIAACRAAGGRLLTILPQVRGDFARKVNYAAKWTLEPWLFQAADDVRFEPGWDTALLACAAATGAKVVGSNDCANPTVKRGDHATHILFARDYIDDPGASLDGPGTVFSEAYGHQWCDTEAVELAKRRGVWAFCEAARVVHEHPFFEPGKAAGAVMDETYRRGMASSRDDALLYRKRMGRVGSRRNHGR